ncbi:MAG: hypothetical protein IT558_03700 [Alphaproteobacteria bacterium]|nr:hypothetical protein [Alphaproteobacteria bacterium]
MSIEQARNLRIAYQTASGGLDRVGAVEMVRQVVRNFYKDEPPRRTGEPAWAHPLELGDMHSYSLARQLAGYLHDLPEDFRDLLLDEVKALVDSARVTNTVGILTRCKQGAWKEPYFDYNVRIGRSPIEFGISGIDAVFLKRDDTGLNMAADARGAYVLSAEQIWKNFAYHVTQPYHIAIIKNCIDPGMPMKYFIYGGFLPDDPFDFSLRGMTDDIRLMGNCAVKAELMRRFSSEGARPCPESVPVAA